MQLRGGGHGSMESSRLTDATGPLGSAPAGTHQGGVMAGGSPYNPLMGSHSRSIAVAITCIAVGLAAAVSGCRIGGGMRTGEVRSRHAGEFSCAPEQVAVIEHSYSTFEARGCGYRAMYACAGASTCVRNSEATPLGGPAPQQPATAPPSTAPPAPPAGPDPETTLRQGLEARRDAILSCTAGTATTVVAAYDAQGNVFFSLGDAMAGSDAEACVRRQLGSVHVDTGGRSGAVSQPIAP